MAFGHQLSEKVVKRLVKEDIYQGEGRLLGVRYVDSLKVVSCSEKSCVLSFTYETSGCNWDDCFDLSCKGLLEFDQNEILTEVKEQTCTDL